MASAGSYGSPEGGPSLSVVADGFESGAGAVGAGVSSGIEGTEG